MLHSGIESGWNSIVTIEAGEVTKTNIRGYNTSDEAWAVVEGLNAYAAELDLQPLRTASLHEASVIPDNTGQYEYLIHHTYDLIDGPSIVKIDNAEDRQRAVGQALSGIVDMDTTGDVDTLRIPIDAKAENFHVDNQSPALVDIFPSLSRLPDGSFPLSQLAIGSLRGRGGFWEYAAATKSGALTRMLFTTLSGTPREKLGRLIRPTDDWCYDVIPPQTDSVVRDKVRKQLNAHFLPYLGRRASDRAWELLNSHLPS